MRRCAAIRTCPGHNQDELGICGKAFLFLDRAPQIVSLADELVEYRAREYDSHANVLASGAVQPPRSRRAGSRRRRPFRVCADVGHYKHKQFTAALTFSSTFSSELLPRAPMCSLHRCGCQASVKIWGVRGFAPGANIQDRRTYVFGDSLQTSRRLVWQSNGQEQPFRTSRYFA